MIKKQKLRKRTETTFSQLNGQFMLRINYVEIFIGFKTRLMSKITAFTTTQYINFFVENRSLNKIKINLA